jgi:molybdate transport system ATP-binding protein
VALRSEARTLALFGPSGAGKSLTLRCLAGLMTPDAGRVALGGRVFFDSEAGVDLPPQQRRVGYVPQNYALFPHLRVLDNVAYGLANLPRRQRDARARELLALVQLDGYGDRRPAELSGGQQQRVAIARALAIRPPLLLLDEPFASLDHETRLQMRAELRRIQAEVGPTVVLVTHDPEDVTDLAEQVVVYENGLGRLLDDLGSLHPIPGPHSVTGS